MAKVEKRDVLVFSPDVPPAEIASKLKLPLGSTKRLISQIIEGEGVKSRAEATLRAVASGEISIDDIIWSMDD